eukprot:TRINITY_DN9248_c0_g2_i1.p1 TRINITY_DN9248_c0_g2~~TRINITY_DN9248_c0_g2_i1.p1  ORF type:complete len:376 (+),score=75.05 TRINITY_DN9248_c0_g2_i1:265-1392(+)
MNANAKTKSRQSVFTHALTLPTSEGLHSDNDSIVDSSFSDNEVPSDAVIATLLSTCTPKKCFKSPIDTFSFLTKIASTPNTLNGGKKIEFPEKDLFDGRIESYNLGKEIGHGSYAVVRQCTHNDGESTDCAMKIYDKNQSFTARKRRGVLHEIQILKTLSHPHVVRLYETIENADHLCLVFEHVKGGSLCDYLRRVPSKKLCEQEAKRLFRQIVSAMEYCHSKSVVHRDLKLENILLDSKKEVKIIDFGFSVVVNTVCKLSMFCGTALYVAPEIVSRKSYWGPPVDVWSLGVILYAMLSGRFPFRGNSESELYKSISKGVYSTPKGVSEDAAKLLASLLNPDPFKRPTCSNILKDPFLRAESADISSISERCEEV